MFVSSDEHTFFAVGMLGHWLFEWQDAVFCDFARVHASESSRGVRRSDDDDRLRVGSELT